MEERKQLIVRYPHATRANNLMKILLIVAITLVASGCVNAVRMCGPENVAGSRQLRRPPDNAAALIDLVRTEQTQFPYGGSKHHYWFERPDGTLLLCRQNPGWPTQSCSSDGWKFERVANQWHGENAWGGLCPIE